MTSGLRHLVKRAQQGDELAREKLIKKHINFVAGVCSRLCGRYLAWENDEELSVGLLALNEAINTFNIKAGVKFTTFAYKVIKWRLIDYSRCGSGNECEIPFSSRECEDEATSAINAEAVRLYLEGKAGEELKYLIDKYNQKLLQFNIAVNELPGIAPKQRGKLNSLFRAARILAQDEKMSEYLLNYGQLPIKQLSISTGLTRKVLEKRRKFIIALAVLLLEPQLAPLLTAAAM